LQRCSFSRAEQFGQKLEAGSFRRSSGSNCASFAEVVSGGVDILIKLALKPVRGNCELRSGESQVNRCGAALPGTESACPFRASDLIPYFVINGKLLLQELAIMSQTPSRRQACRNLPRSAMVVPFACRIAIV